MVVPRTISWARSGVGTPKARRLHIAAEQRRRDQPGGGIDGSELRPDQAVAALLDDSEMREGPIVRAPHGQPIPSSPAPATPREQQTVAAHRQGHSFPIVATQGGYRTSLRAH